jgi:DNA-directed RNA polymerase III subunit RPC1
LQRLQALIIAGPNHHPGANNIESANQKWSLRGVSPATLRERAAKLNIGDIVERHLEDGDVVLFNRQPSLHRLSIMVCGGLQYSVD